MVVGTTLREVTSRGWPLLAGLAPRGVVHMETLLKVLVASPQETIWEGRAKAVSSINLEGPFDILPFHATFVTIVNGNSVKVHLENGKSTEFKFDRCVIFNRNNRVSVYTQV